MSMAMFVVGFISHHILCCYFHHYYCPQHYDYSYHS